MSVTPIHSDNPAARALAERHRFRWWEPLPWLLALAFYFAFPRYLGFGTELLITVLFAISLDLALGYAGIVTLGHAAFFGAGAYTVGMLAKHGIWTEPITRPVHRRGGRGRGRPCLRPGAAAHHRPDAADAHALHHGAAGGSRQHGRRWSPAASTASTACRSSRCSASSSSIRCIPTRSISTCSACCWSASCSCASLVYSPFGQSLTGIRENTLRMHAVGAPVRRRLVVCYTISAAIAGIAGALWAQANAYVNLSDARPRPRRDRADHPGARRLRPALRRLRRRGRLHGARRTSSPRLYPTAWQLGLGLLLVIIALFARNGILGIVDDHAWRPASRRAQRVMTALLETRVAQQELRRARAPRATSTSRWRQARATR